MTRTRHGLRGATLIELLVGLVISLMVVMTALGTAARYHRSGSTVLEWMNVRGQLRSAADILAGELVGISMTGDSLLAATDTSVEFRSAIGASMICLVPSANRITLPPDSLVSGRILSSWALPPDSGDTVLLYQEASSPAPAKWIRRQVISFTAVRPFTGCPAAAGLISAAELAGAGSAYDVTLDGDVALAHSGTPVRIVRRVRYSMYKAGDGHWYLGYRSCTPSCAGIQPVSGPYDFRGRVPLTLRYLDESGANVTPSASTAAPAAMAILVRTSFSRPLSFPGVPPRSGDSISTVVAFRNFR